MEGGRGRRGEKRLNKLCWSIRPPLLPWKNRVHVEESCCTRVQGTRGCVFRGCVDRLARLPAIGPNSVCISLWWQLEVSRVRTRWLRGSLVSRRHLSSCCSLEATANPLSSSSFSFCLYLHLLLPLFQPRCNPSQGNHASKEREGRRSGESIGVFWRFMLMRLAIPEWNQIVLPW